jgi:hypothetical protein
MLVANARLVKGLTTPEGVDIDLSHCVTLIFFQFCGQSRDALGDQFVEAPQVLMGAGQAGNPLISHLRVVVCQPERDAYRYSPVSIVTEHQQQMHQSFGATGAHKQRVLGCKKTQEQGLKVYRWQRIVTFVREHELKLTAKSSQIKPVTIDR